MSECPKCGAELPHDAPAGLCPRCLVRAGFDSEDEFASPAAPSHPAAHPTAQLPASAGFEPPSPEELASGFPQLEIQELLGHGGMGAVYKARQIKLDRLVALKIIRPESADVPAFAERFNREARALARLNHPNIVAVHDFGEVTMTGSGGQDAAPRTLYYFLMEYVEGANLRQLLQGGELQPEPALAIIPQICEALQFAHDAGIVHRDIKPENILVDTKGKAKIADFGLARLVASSPRDFTLTGTHQVMGTPRYMAPEQMAGSHGVDHRADIYSLGVVFYEMLTGEVPMGQFEPPSKRAPVDGRLDEVVLRALAREPERRYQQASEMKSGVEEISSSCEPSRRTGISTIFEREVQNAWNWIADDFRQTTRQPPTPPALLMIMMSIAGGLMIILPWMDLEIDKLTTMSEVSVVLEKSVTRRFDGYEVWSGIAAAVTFSGLALLLITAPTKERLAVWRSAAMTGIAALALLLTFLFRVELGSHTYPVSFVALRNDSKASTEPEFHGAFLSAIEHRITYRAGFYGSLGLSLGLLLLSATGIRHAVGQRGESLGEVGRAGPPLTSLRFTIPADQEIGPQVVFHFLGLGYHLVDEQPNAWVFQRGNHFAGLWSNEIRALHTMLSVSTAPRKEGDVLVGCVWTVRTLGAWIGSRDIKQLEAEGRELQSLLGGGDDRTSGDSESLAPPRYSVAAIIGALLSLVMIAVAIVGCVVAWQSQFRLADEQPQSVDWTLLLITGVVVVIGGGITTLVGIVSMNGIRNSQGSVVGLGLAFTVTVLFPLLLVDAVIYGLCLLVESNSRALAVAPLLCFLADALLIRFAWRIVSLPASEQTKRARSADEKPPPLGADR